MRKQGIVVIAIVLGSIPMHAMGGYAGLEAPGNVPEVFAPGVVSTDAYEFAVSFAPDMREMYFTRRESSGPNRIVVARVHEGALQAPVAAPFSRPGGEYEACVSPDGRSVFFAQGAEIVSCTLTREGWSDPTPLPAEVNEGGAMAMWVDDAGSLYFTRRGGLVVVRPEGEGYTAAELLDPMFGPPAGDAAHGFIAPDRSYVIFDSQSREGGQGRADLYVSFATEEGGWTEARNLEALNTSGTEMCASVSPDERFLFFCRDGDIFWVDAEVIETYREAR